MLKTNLLAKARDFVLSHRRLAQSALAVCLFAGALAFSAQPLSAEGTADTIRTSLENYRALNTSASSDDSTLLPKMSRWNFFAHGHDTKDKTGGVSQQMKVKFYAYEGETVFIASSAVNTDEDIYITKPDGKGQYYDLLNGAQMTNDNESKGPKGVHKAILDTDGKQTGNDENAISDGYDAFQFDIEQSGVYTVEFFSSKNPGKVGSKYHILSEVITDYQSNETEHVASWDVTVCKKTGDEDNPTYNAVSGRVWMDAIPMETNGVGIYGYLYTTTRDGYIWRFAFNGIYPCTTSIYANQRGGISTATNASAYHSVHSPIDNYTPFDYYKDMTDKNGNKDGLMIYGPDNETTDIDAPDHMFFNYPDPNLPESILPKNALASFEVKDISFDGRDPTVHEFVSDSGEVAGGDDSENYHKGTVGTGGYFTVDTGTATSYRVIIDMSNMYARYYHGEEGSPDNAVSGEDHDEEICLSLPKSEGAEHINFIYYNKADGKWHNISTKVKDKEGKYDMHPVNDATNDMVSKLVSYDEILDDDILTKLGIDNKDPNGQEVIGNGTYKFKSLGKIMIGNAAVEGQTDRIYWNGRDQWGRILPVGWYFGNTGRGEVYAEGKAGEVHFPISDAENVTSGLAVWLMNPPSTVLNTVGEGNPYYKSASDLRSKLFYNNREKSLLRDYVVALPNSESPQESGTLATVWNLPSSGNNRDAGLGSKNNGKSELNLKWYSGTDFNSDFEDVSIEGKASYSDNSGTKITGTAAKISGDGVDHGIFDVWTHVISPNQVTLNEPIVLYHFADRKIITGFVYLDTPEKGADRGVYDRMTNDHELEGAIIVAEYGDESKKNDESSKDNTTGPRWVHYEAKTDTDGYYSIPVDLTAFGDDVGTKYNGTVANPVYPVTIWVYYNENISGAVTHIVTTIGQESDYSTAQQFDKFLGEEIQSYLAPSISKQIVKIPKYIDDLRPPTETNVYLKEVYAGQVGYVAEPTGEALNITKKWEPSYLKSTSLKASFTIVGMKSGARTKVEDFFKDHSEGITVKELVDGKLVDVKYDSTKKEDYITNYGTNAAGDGKPEGDEPFYMAIEHDPAFPSNETIANIYKAVSSYNAKNPTSQITMEEVIVNGHNFGDGNIFDHAPTSGEPATSNYIYVVENATTEEARGGIYTNKILPAHTYKVNTELNTAEADGTIVYRVYENPMLNEKGEDVSTDNTVSRIKNDWTYTNMLSTVDYTLTVYYDHN